jgi:Flp pilus assembly protein TadG
VLVLPILVTVISGAVDLGRIIEGNLKLSNAVRVGADYAAAHRSSPDHASDWKARVQDSVLMEASNLRHFDSARLAVEVTTLEVSELHTIVTVSASYSLPLTLFWVSSDTRVPLQHSVSTRQIR